MVLKSTINLKLIVAAKNGDLSHSTTLQVEGAVVNHKDFPNTSPVSFFGLRRQMPTVRTFYGVCISRMALPIAA